jgi:hypothetical protein
VKDHKSGPHHGKERGIAARLAMNLLASSDSFETRDTNVAEGQRETKHARVPDSQRSAGEAAA